MTDLDPDHYLRERYRGERERSALMAGYYAVKPFMPRRVQLTLRRLYAKRQARAEFPRWPFEPILLDHQATQLRERMAATGADAVPLVGFWPEGKRFAAILTHDVEGPLGVRNVRRVLEIERRHGFVSSWNFVAEWYPIEDGLFDHIRAHDGEIGLHAIKHDCKLFESRASFEADLPAIHRYLREWGAVGFRSPATHRNAEWMPELGCLYDSSFPDSDPFEPQAGGCCSIFPYFLDDLVELPITLLQDHTMWEILRADTIEHWTRKSDWLIAHHGLVNLITHPDYLDTPARLRQYEEFLEYLAAQEGMWHALPHEVASWWRERASLRCVVDEDGARIEGAGAERATVAWARAGDGPGVVYDIEPVGALR